MTMVKRAADEDVRRLYDVLAGVEDAEAMRALLVDLCTIGEVDELAQRLAVAFLLDAGESYVAIGERTGASATTIARVSKALNYGAGGYRAAIDGYRQP
jgi:TrpR-related protein YerC/YecD